MLVVVEGLVVASRVVQVGGISLSASWSIEAIGIGHL